jgi:hypothetical protein
MTASVPEFANRTISAAGTIPAMRSTTASSRCVDSAQAPPVSIPARAAASTRGSQ